jgi:hypothetical protein
MRVAAVRKDNRFATRLDVCLEAKLREVGSSSRFKIAIEDLSLTGFRATTSFRLAEGQTVVVTIPTLAPLEARVAWAKGYAYGCAFDRALHVAVFDHLVRQFRAI